MEYPDDDLHFYSSVLTFPFVSGDVLGNVGVIPSQLLFSHHVSITLTYETDVTHESYEYPITAEQPKEDFQTVIFRRY